MNHVRFHNRARCLFQSGVDMRKQMKETSTKTSKAFQADNPGFGDQNIDSSANIVYRIMNRWTPPRRRVRGRFRIRILATMQHSTVNNRDIRANLTVSIGSFVNSPAVLMDPRLRLANRRNHIKSNRFACANSARILDAACGSINNADNKNIENTITMITLLPRTYII